MPGLETEVEALLKRRIPGIEQRWQGASAEEIEAIETIAGQPLPDFYRWFLRTLGGSAAEVSPSYDGFRAAAVLDAYDRGDVEFGSPLLLLGRKPDMVMPLDVYYDLSQPMRGDALVLTQPPTDGHLRKAAETFAEYLAWTVLNVHGISTRPQRCRGIFKDESLTTSESLARVMEVIGFTRPLQTGPYCALFERSDADVACTVAVAPENRRLLIFTAGGDDTATVRRVLGHVSTESSLSVQITEWDPPIQAP
jgi:hypothetical protein